MCIIIFIIINYPKIISYNLNFLIEYRRAFKPEHSRPTKQTLSNRWLYCLQISSMDAKTSFLHGSFSKCSYKATDAQMAWVTGFNNFCLSSHPRNNEDGNHKNWRREGWTSSRGKLIYNNLAFSLLYLTLKRDYASY